MRAAFYPPAGDNANAFALNPLTGTAYLVNIGGAAFLQPMRVTRCDAANQRGCRSEAPAVADPEFLYSVDPATDTIYAGDLSAPRIDVINGATCRTGRLSHCAPVAKIPMPDPQANVGAIDEATHTSYASDEATAGTLAMINTAACNAIHIAGSTGRSPLQLAPDHGARTLYVADFSSAAVTVLNLARCTASVTAGSGTAARQVAVGLAFTGEAERPEPAAGPPLPGRHVPAASCLASLPGHAPAAGGGECLRACQNPARWHARVAPLP